MNEDDQCDLIGIRAKWLQVCPCCDAGLSMDCTHPTEDYRVTMQALVDELERRREEATS